MTQLSKNHEMFIKRYKGQLIFQAKRNGKHSPLMIEEMLSLGILEVKREQLLGITYAVTYEAEQLVAIPRRCNIDTAAARQMVADFQTLNAQIAAAAAIIRNS